MDNPIIIIDPEIQGGDPTIKGHGIRTAVVYDLWLGEKKQIKPVCEWFNITEEEAIAAIDYEETTKENRMRTYFRNRFYLRGTTWLGLLNTLLAYLFNRVFVRHISEAGKTVRWSVKHGTDFPPA